LSTTTPTPRDPDPSTLPPPPPWRWRPEHSFALVVLAAGIPGSGYFLTPRSHLASWAAVMGMLVGMTVVIGLAATGRPVGALIDRRNMLSLSRLQLWLWTILVSSGYFVAGMINVLAGQPDPLQVNIPDTLWALMAIGTTSFVGAPLIQGAKARGQVEPAERERSLQALATRSGRRDAEDLASIGQLVVNRDAAAAAPADLIMGEEVGDAGYVSLGKLQLGFSVLLALILYASALAEVLAQSAPIRALPGLDNGLVTLLGISHIGYLGGKAVPSTLSPPIS
jgi:hypothetical protein